MGLLWSRSVPQTIHSVPGDYRVAKTLIAAQYNNVKIDTPKFELGKDNKSAAFEAKNALKKVSARCRTTRKHQTRGCRYSISEKSFAGPRC